MKKFQYITKKQFLITLTVSSEMTERLYRFANFRQSRILYFNKKLQTRKMNICSIFVSALHFLISCLNNINTKSAEKNNYYYTKNRYLGLAIPAALIRQYFPMLILLSLDKCANKN